MGRDIDVTDEPCTALTPLQRDFTAMKSFELGAVPDADNGDLGQLADQGFHDVVQALLIECRRRLIKNDDIRIVKQETGKSEPLLFAA